MQNSAKVRPDLDIWVVPRFAQEVLGVDPVQIQNELENHYPVVGKGDAIAPMEAQRVDGVNKALNFRGNDLKRCKMWFQRGDPKRNGYVKYDYTGWQNNILPATSDVDACPEMAPIANMYDDWVQRAGYPCANHYIVTKYANGDDNIGFHYDKPQSIAPGSLITVVKTGPHGRPFQLRDRVFLDCLPGEDEKAFKVRSDAAQSKVKPFFDEVEANLRTQQAVPAVDHAGPSGSIVFRTITERVSTEPARKKARKM